MTSEGVVSDDAYRKGYDEGFYQGFIEAMKKATKHNVAGLSLKDAAKILRSHCKRCGEELDKMSGICHCSPLSIKLDKMV